MWVLFSSALFASVLLPYELRGQNDFQPRQEGSTGLWGLTDDLGNFVVLPAYATLKQVDEHTAIGFKPDDPDAYLLGTGGRFRHVPHDRYWAAWKAALEASSMHDKELISRVLGMYADPILRSKEMENMERTYQDIVNVRNEAVRSLLRE